MPADRSSQLSSHASYSRRFTFEDLDIRGQVIRLGDAWQTLMRGRTYPEDVTRYFGELACVAVFVGTGLKHPGRVTLQIQGASTKTAEGGASKRSAKLAVVECTHSLGLRGMAASGGEEELVKPTDGFAEWVGGGTLAMTVQNSDSGQMYQSIVPISGLSVAECFEHYFDQSEQLPTHLWLAATPRGAGALMLQKLPKADERDADGWARMEMLASSVTEAELVSMPIDLLLRRLFAEEDIRLYEPKGVHSNCTRDEEKVKNVLRSLGREELEGTLAEYGEVIVKDDMCNQEYRFDPAAIAALFDENKVDEKDSKV
ncbi:MAG: Hsp33 family molecular chaperone HslO [Burkholderiales bacterium]|jgi:molecular chaperone Hsp33|nr:Hsp33 family molecular chaperone HslO [Rhodocyclaceae bacterium]MCA3021820.1 Hsp33 family molecular chaperone HslO [Rhodocyclaceae bacterium]MCA3052980.1 Hsp33 family molecular chaperone HslO [Rhodocyclaceae bacterium]